jgi:hypothetical protein
MDIAVQNDMFLMIKQAVSEAIKEERLNLYLSLLPTVSDEEMEDIVSKHGTPSKNNEYTDISNLFDVESNNK